MKEPAMAVSLHKQIAAYRLAYNWLENGERAIYADTPKKGIISIPANRFVSATWCDRCIFP